jgi:uncharacterized protein YutE (UPF0331/DUF86 family)/predicted nucleotidyltransferase
MKNDLVNRIIRDLSLYFKGRSDIAFAYLFGSFSRGNPGPLSDVDVGLYFFPKSDELELEEEVFYRDEDQIWADLEKICGRELDLLVMNRAPARVVNSALSEGIELYMRDRALFLRVLLGASQLFDEYKDFTRSFMAIKARSRSLSETDRDRLRRIADFLETELDDLPQFRTLDYKEYQINSGTRRNVERWVENCVNAAIDAAKIIVASQKQHIPQTYRETLQRLKAMEGFTPEVIDPLSSYTHLRNILAHEYLDLRFNHIRRFIQEAEPHYRAFLDGVKGQLNDKE